MIVKLPKFIALIAKHFAGMRKSIAKLYVTQDVTGCEFETIIYPFDSDLMDGKRLIAIASGSIEDDEVALAQKYLDSDDVIVEFGSGMGIAAVRVHQAVSPKAHYCFEANPKPLAYAENLFAKNNLSIVVENMALGDGATKTFYAVDDYILSSFDKPQNRSDFEKIEIGTIAVAEVIKDKHPTAIFCDIEGAEGQFLPPEDLHGVNKVIIELHPHAYGTAGVDRIQNSFLAHGFRCVDTKGDTYCFIRLS
jgi:FkbM family methyltransferase